MEFPDENLEQNVNTSEEREAVQERAVSAPSLSQEDIQDRLDRYDGFDELLGPLAENLNKFSPEAKGKKRRFLQDEDLVDERKELKDRLAAYLVFLENPEISSHKQVVL